MIARFRFAALALLLLPATLPAQGIYLTGGGAVHQTMGGASTATPVDAIGALYWNPAAIGKLGRSEASFGGSFLFPDFHLTSTDFLGRTGTTRSDSGVCPTTSLGVVLEPNDTPWTFGVGLMTLGGGGVNYPGDVSNPILSGVGPLGNVQGPIGSSITLIQMMPTAAVRVADRLVVGLGPTINVSLSSFDPAFFGAPDDANGDGIGMFPSGSHSRPYWGGGYRAGLVYSVTPCFDVGIGYTSEQWFETWKYYTNTERGQPRTLTLNPTLPAIYSLGLGWRATEKLLLVFDVRYFDYENTGLFGERIVDGGLGWQSIFAAAIGTRYQMNDKIALMAGYVYNENPIPSTGTLFNIQAPAITQHTVSVGTTTRVTERMSVSLGYAYGFQNSITGPIREATGTGVSYETSVQTLNFTMQFDFGARCCSH